MRKIDLPLLSVVVFLTFFGLLMIFSASSYIAFRDFGDKYHFVKEQLIWIIVGIGALFGFAFSNYRRLFLLSLPMLLAGIVFLVLVFIPPFGVRALGAARWIDVGLFTLQPTEFIKLALAVYLAAWFSQKERGRLPAFLLLIGIVLVLVLLEPDMGTATIILIEALSVYFLSGGSVWYFTFLVPMIGTIGYFLIKYEPYRAKRLTSFLQFDSFAQSSYHVRQILISLGSGGLFGLGLGNSIQKYAYLPENATDSIFAIIGEELGFVGSVVLILLFLFVIWRGFRIAGGANDVFGKLLAGGITSFLAAQMLINLGAQTALLPLTGVPLPFISYGGSALIVNLCAVGILLSIGRKK